MLVINQTRTVAAQWVSDVADSSQSKSVSMWSILTSRQLVNDAVIIYLTQLNQLARQQSVVLGNRCGWLPPLSIILTRPPSSMVAQQYNRPHWLSIASAHAAAIGHSIVLTFLSGTVLVVQTVAKERDRNIATNNCSSLARFLCPWGFSARTFNFKQKKCCCMTIATYIR